MMMRAAGRLVSFRSFTSSRLIIAANTSTRSFSSSAADQHTWFSDPSLEPVKVLLKVPFDDREAAKALGAKWDKEAKSWYAFAEDKKVLERWPAKGTEKKYLSVPFDAKDEAKAMGAWWDAEAKRWYAPHGEEHLIQKFGLAPPAPALAADEHGEKVYIAVPFAEKDDAKAAGARWDTDRKCWYTTDKRLLDRWGPKTEPSN